MYFFDESRREELIPQSLQGKYAAQVFDEINRYISLPEKERDQTDVPPVWKYKLEPDVLNALTQLSHQRCAFCERKGIRLTSYRFRPPSRAHEEKLDTLQIDKSSYLWLAFNWWNFFPICDDCRPANISYFPVVGARHTLENGTRRAEASVQPTDTAVFFAPGDPQLHRFLDVDLNGELVALNEGAMLTLQHFHLNRPDLVRDRQDAFKYCLTVLQKPGSEFEVYQVTGGTEVPVENWTEYAHAGAIFLLMQKIGKVLNQRLGTRHRLSIEWIEKSLNKQKKHPEFAQVVQHLTADLSETVAQPEKSSGAVTDAIKTPNPSRIKSITIENFKSLEGIELRMPETIDVQRDRWYSITETSGEIPEAPCLLILGENATGKSSILEAFTLACIPENERQMLELSPGKMTLNPHYLGAGVDTVPRALASVHVELYGSDTAGEVFDMAVTATPPEIKVTTRTGRHPMIFAYGAHRLFGTSSRDDDVTAHIDTLFRDDRQIANPEPWLVSLFETNPSALDGVVQALRHIIQIDGEFENITVVADKDGKKHCVINVKKQGKVTATGAPSDYVVPQYLSIASSGYRAVLAVVCDVLKGLMLAAGDDIYAARRSQAIVLIDEIEAHLHPRWKLELITGLRKALPQTTFLLTSHDPLCIRGMLNGEVRLLNRYQTGTPPGVGLPEVVEQVQDFGQIETLTIEQILVSDLFQLYSTDDRSTDQTLAQAAEILMRERAAVAFEAQRAVAENRAPVPRPDLADHEQVIVDRLHNEIAGSLPDGRTEVSLLVQEAVAEFLVERRNAQFVHTGGVREKAKREVKAYLQSLL